MLIDYIKSVKFDYMSSLIDNESEFFAVGVKVHAKWLPKKRPQT